MNAIKQFRTKYKLTQTELGKIIQRKRKQIYRFESGKNKIPDDVIMRLDNFEHKLEIISFYLFFKM